MAHKGDLRVEYSRRRQGRGITNELDTPLKWSTYRAWVNMRQRCLNPNDRRYHDWGGRGITICDRWKDFRNFLEDMGWKPTLDHSLHRINNNGNYEPTNCKWATWKEQYANRKQ